MQLAQTVAETDNRAANRIVIESQNKPPTPKKLHWTPGKRTVQGSQENTPTFVWQRLTGRSRSARWGPNLTRKSASKQHVHETTMRLIEGLDRKGIEAYTGNLPCNRQHGAKSKGGVNVGQIYDMRRCICRIDWTSRHPIKRTLVTDKH